MHIVVSHKDIKRAFERVCGVIAAKPEKPILVNAVMVAKDGALHVRGTDLYLSMSCKIACEVNKHGTMIINARDTLEKLRVLPPGPVQIREVGGKCEVQSIGTKKRHTLTMPNSEDYPPFPFNDGTNRIKMTARALSRVLAMVEGCIKEDDASNPGVCCARIEFDGAMMHVVGTNGHRMTHVAIQCDAQATNLLITKKGVVELRKMIDSTRNDVESTDMYVSINGAIAFFECAGVTFGAKMVDATFPDWRGFLKLAGSPVTNHAIVGRAKLIECIRSATAGLSDKMMRLAIGSGKISIEARSDTSESTDEVDVDCHGTPVVMGMYMANIIGILEALDCQDIRIGYGHDLDPLYIAPHPIPQDEHFDAPVMPSRLGEAVK